MLARRLATIRPAMRRAAALETTRIHRVAGLFRGECQPTLMSTGDGEDTEAILGRFPLETISRTSQTSWPWPRSPRGP
jgi:predicted ATPase with chaperone activity